MISYKYPHKDKIVKLFYLKKKENDDGTLYISKVYISKPETKLRAYLLDVSAQKNVDPTEISVNQTYFIMNWRPTLSIASYLEYDGRTYQINGIDELDHRHTEVRITGQTTYAPKVNTIEYLNASMSEALYED